MLRQTGNNDHGSCQTIHFHAVVFSVTKLLMNILRTNLFLGNRD